MRRKPTSDPNRIVYVRTRGRLAPLGALLLSLGLWGLSASLTAAGVRPTLVGCMAVVSGVGLTLLLLGIARVTLTFDGSVGGWRHEGRCLVPLGGREGGFETLARIVFVPSEPYKTLLGEDGTQPAIWLDIGRCRIRLDPEDDEVAAQQEAEDLARLTGCPLTDFSFGVCKVYHPDKPFETLSARWQRLGRLPAEVIRRPEATRTAVHVESETLALTIPPGRRSYIWSRSVAMTLIGAVSTSVTVSTLLLAGDVGLALMLGFGTVALPLLAMTRYIRFHERLVRATVSLTLASGWLQCTHEAKAANVRTMFAADDILNLDVSRKRWWDEHPEADGALVLRGVDGDFVFGEHLSLDEKLWIKSLIERVVVAAGFVAQEEASLPQPLDQPRAGV